MALKTKIGMAAISLLCPVLTVSAADTDSLAVVPTDTVSVLKGQTIADEKRVLAKKTLLMDNTTVTGSGCLRVTAEDSIVILGETTVMPGGILMLNGAGQYAIRYYYDASGNRTRRKKAPTIQ